ncbi:MAG: cytidine deaminase [Ardenticatenaceae bacterium]|nr:cytidine deaminase [Anaerolineales bacterium]MCB8941339.1 cytidine deaminase [Ardenticatenaceae bacterium]MCB8972695.1 cytidine deaminase [Ardenticatenaceae bacterium]
MVNEEQRTTLIEAAMAIRERAYVPYSHYPVGAALLMEDGTIITGVNVENSSYGLTICAERTAVTRAITAGYRKILAVAVATDNAGSPCGACRQVLTEFAGDVPVYLVDATGNGRDTTLHTLLPDHFGPEHLGS